jgi:hypothetical protein
MVKGMSAHDPEFFLLARTTGATTLPTTIEQRANSFATSAADCDAATIVAFRDESGVRTLLSVAGPPNSVMSTALSLAQAVGARAEKIEEVPAFLSEVNAVARMTADPKAAVSRQPLIGTDPTEMARIMAMHLRPGDWVALTLREPSSREERRNSDWVLARLGGLVGAHQSQSRDARVVSLYAGSSSQREARALLARAASAMQGFDLKVKAETVSVLSGVRGWLAATGLSLAALAGLKFSTPTAPILVENASTLTTILGGLALLCGLISLARWRGWFPTLAHRVYDGMSVGLLPDPPHRRIRPAAPREAEKDYKTGKTTKARPGDYPLHRSAFLVQPSIFVGLASPHSGTDAGAAAAQQRSVPIPMQQRIGPLVGFDGDIPAYLSSTAAWAGVAIVGRPSSGKSVTTRSMFGWACMDRNDPSGIPGTTGDQSTLIAFESKDFVAVREYQAWAAASADKAVLIDLADPNAYAIDLIAGPGTVGQRAEAWVNGLVYAFESGAIQDLSYDVLKRIYTGALAADEDRSLAAGIDGIQETGSFNYFADVLVGNRGDSRGKALADEIMARAARPETATPSMIEAAEALAPLFAGKTESQRRTTVAAAANKIAQLASMEQWWSPARKKITWEQVLGTEPRHRAIIINTGTSSDNVPVEHVVTSRMTSLIFFTLQRAIARLCQGWEAQGRSVSIYSDELSLLAGSSEEVILWLKDQGRSYGVRPVLATQRPEQLPPKVRKLILNFGTLVCFNQDAVDTAEEVARAMSGSDGPLEATEIMHLPEYHAVIRAYVGQDRQPAFIVKMHNFEADRAAARTIQGFEPEPRERLKALPAGPSAQVSETPVLPNPTAPAPVAMPGVPTPVAMPTPALPLPPAPPAAVDEGDDDYFVDLIGGGQ